MKLIKNKKNAFGFILFVLVAAIVVFLLREFISNYVVRVNMNSIDAPGNGVRVLIFSPHNDDETLGAAEMIKKTIKNGGDVKVVFITNGDGFKEAIQFDYLNLNPKSHDYIDFGYRRQKESIEALKALGLSEKNIIFLGYPDGGISYLWNAYWDMNNPYISRYTQSNKSPYSNTYTKGTLYTGESVIRDMTKIIRDYNPTHIIYPHPNDRHPDHWATNAFIKYVLTSINYSPLQEFLYLVHRGDWPTPLKREPTMYLVPPAKLINMGTDWYALNLNQNEAAEKGDVIHIYRTQIKVLGPLLNGFERRNELFGVYSNVKLYTANSESSSIKPVNENKIISDPLQDALTLQISKGADISGVYMEQASNKDLNVFVEVDGDVEELTKYHVNLIFFGNDKVSRLNIEVKDGKISVKHVSKQSIMNVNGIHVDSKDKVLHVVIPNTVFGDFNHAFINATTSIEDRMLDKTAWRMIDK